MCRDFQRGKKQYQPYLFDNTSEDSDTWTDSAAVISDITIPNKDSDNDTSSLWEEPEPAAVPDTDDTDDSDTLWTEPVTNTIINNTSASINDNDTSAAVQVQTTPIVKKTTTTTLPTWADTKDLVHVFDNSSTHAVVVATITALIALSTTMMMMMTLLSNATSPHKQ